MQCGEHHVARQRGLDTDVGRFRVAHLAHHDDVRVGTQERFHDHREIDDLFVHLHLPQTFLGNLNRVFGRPDFGVGRIE